MSRHNNINPDSQSSRIEAICVDLWEKARTRLPSIALEHRSMRRDFLVESRMELLRHRTGLAVANGTAV